MFIVNAFQVRNILLSLSLITLAVSSFSTSYATISAVENKIRKRTVIAQSGIPYRSSDAYKYLTRKNFLGVIKRNRIYCICISICFFLSLLSILVEPVHADNYTVKIDSARPYITIVNISKTDGSFSYSEQIDDGLDETQITTNQSALDKCIVTYVWYITIVSVVTSLSLGFLIINMLKILHIQLSLLELDKDFSFK